MSCYIVIDAGTTNLRVSLLSEDWTLLEQASDGAGVRYTAIDGHNGRLRAAVQACVRQVMDSRGVGAGDVRACVAYGMITSNVGLAEIPHLTAPAGPAQFHAGLVTRAFPDLLPFPVTFIPGLKIAPGPATLDNLSTLDMMRGEETEAVGLWAALRPEQDLMLVLPGSHNKFISVGRDGSLRGCMTSISGELLDALTHHTVLADSLVGAFASAGAFTARDARSFLLGAVMRMDLEALEHFSLFSPGQPLYIASKPPLGQALLDLLRAHGHSAALLDEPLRRSMGFLGVKTIWSGGLD